MAEEERRLAAIMFTDIAGYTSMAQRDEKLALKTLDKHNVLLRSIFPKYRGREVKTIGDSFLIEFDSALAATECAIEIQQQLKGLSKNGGENPPIMVRIGIHLGDVVRKNNDILGDAVNVASRIEPVADPGGICISEEVFSLVRNKISYPIELVPAVSLKNVDLPMNIYSIILSTSKLLEPISLQEQSNRLAVLPLSNISPNPQDTYFADGMTEELINVLSQVEGLRVIARTSVMRFRDSPKSISEIGRELKIGFVLEGSVRRADSKIRISAQLIDARSEEFLWGAKFDRDLNDVFAVQDEIAKNVTNSLQLKIVASRDKQPTRNPAAYDSYLKGLQFYHSSKGGEGYRKGIENFDRAIQIDPRYAEAYAAKALCHVDLGYYGYEPKSEAYPKAKELATKALSLGGMVAYAHLAMGRVSFYMDRDWDAAGMEYRQAIELNPSLADARKTYALYLASLGRFDKAIVEAKKAQEVDPLSVASYDAAGGICAIAGLYEEALLQLRKVQEMDPSGSWATNLGVTYVLMGRVEDGIQVLEKVAEQNARAPFFLSNLGYAYAVAGRTEDARKIVAELRKAVDEGNVGPYDLACVYAGLGEKDEALNWLDRAYEANSIIVLPLLTNEPYFASLRQEPRFKKLVKKLGLDKYQTVEAK